MSRTVREIYPGRREDIDDLVTRRPDHPLDRIDPFLFINHHGPQVYPPDNRGLPFGPHPHRGFETVTFIVEGSLTHRDSAGHESTMVAGGVQWMTAGRGVEHSETSPPEFLKNGGPLEILQLWINLPAQLKMTEPRYIGLQKDQISGSPIHRISGVDGAIQSLTGVELMTIDLRAGEKLRVPAPRGRTVLYYDIRQFNLYDMNDDGDDVELTSDRDTLIIFGHAAPLREPIATYGPFVMNTRDEIVQAIEDYQSGHF